jgi:hypothetical protein
MLLQGVDNGHSDSCCTLACRRPQNTLHRRPGREHPAVQRRQRHARGRPVWPRRRPSRPDGAARGGVLKRRHARCCAAAAVGRRVEAERCVGRAAQNVCFVVPGMRWGCAGGITLGRRMPCAPPVAVVADGRLWTGVGQLALRNNVVVEVSASRRLGCTGEGAHLARLSTSSACSCAANSKHLALHRHGCRPGRLLGTCPYRRPSCAPPSAPAFGYAARHGEPAWQLRAMLLPGMAGWFPCSAWPLAPPALTRLLGAPPCCSRRTRSTASGWMCTSSGWAPPCRCPWPACWAPPTAPEPRLCAAEAGCLITSPPVRFSPGYGVDSMVECFVCTSSRCVWGLVAYARTCGSASFWPSTRQPVRRSLPACWQRCSEERREGGILWWLLLPAVVDLLALHACKAASGQIPAGWVCRIHRCNSMDHSR